jgi:peptidoglycan/xylan/chitin deacetylase (PgdA/CDA1 family)
MRSALVVIGALVCLGLGAVGVISAQKKSVATAHLALTSAAKPRLAQARVQDVAQAAISPAATVSPSAVKPAPGPIVLANAQVQNSTVEAAPQAQQTAQTPAPNAAPTGTGAPINGIPACDKPGGMGLSRIVQIDTTGGPGFGFQHFKQYDFLRDKEIVLTFDDGPWPENTAAVLKALSDNCLKATFFEIGEHAMWHPLITKQVIAAGMTVGTHTWSHKDLARNPYASDLDLAKQEIEMGISAVHTAAEAPIAPFFRFPDLQHPPALLSYLAERNIGVFSTDIDSRDFKLHKPEQVIQSVMQKLQRRGKGIILMHDFQRATAEALPELLRQLKAAGFKVVHLVPQQPVTTIAKYDEMVMQKDKLSVNNTRPERSVVHTIGEYYGSPAPGTAGN